MKKRAFIRIFFFVCLLALQSCVGIHSQPRNYDSKSKNYEKKEVFEDKEVCPKNSIKLDTIIFQVVNDDGVLVKNVENSDNGGDLIYIKRKGFFKGKADADFLKVVVKRDGSYKYETMQKGYFKTVAAYKIVECRVQRIKIVQNEQLVEIKDNKKGAIGFLVFSAFIIFTIVAF